MDEIDMSFPGLFLSKVDKDCILKRKKEKRERGDVYIKKKIYYSFFTVLYHFKLGKDKLKKRID
jgi:hypothetical protein